MSALADLQATCRGAGIPCDDAVLAGLERLLPLLQRWNARTNLVGDASPAGLCSHSAEALAVAAAVQEALGRPAAQVVDVGAGAGLEALTLALCWPQARVTALEPRAKRAGFIAVAADLLQLRRVAVVQKDLAAAHLPAHHDLATARAVWAAPEWLRRGRGWSPAGGVVAVHGAGPAAALRQALDGDGWRVLATRAVPGPAGHAVAVLAPVAAGALEPQETPNELARRPGEA